MANGTVDFPMFLHNSSHSVEELVDATHGDLWHMGSMQIHIDIRTK